MKRSTLRDLMIEKKDMLRVLYLQEVKRPHGIDKVVCRICLPANGF